MEKVNRVINGYLKEGQSLSEGKKEAAISIKKLLQEIDLAAEVVPENSFDMFTRLITSLKGDRLNSNEKAIIKEIVNI